MPEPVIHFSETEIDFAKNLISGYELFLLPIYWILLTRIAMYFLKRYEVKDLSLAKNALHLKFFGSIIANLIYCLYYKGGDSNAYFNDGWLINKVLFSSPSLGIKLFFTGNLAENTDPVINALNEQFRYGTTSDTWLVCKFSAFFQLFTFRGILLTGMMFAFFSFFTFWIFFKKIVSLVPGMKKQASWCIFFVPGVIVWGSGIFKDTICISCLFLLFAGFHDIFFRQKNIIKWAVIMFFAGLVLFIIKNYILFAFVACAALWLVFSFSRKFFTAKKSVVLKVAAVLMLLMICFYSGRRLILFVQQEALINDLIIKGVKTGVAMKMQAENNNQGTSSYDIGDIDPSFSGILHSAVAASNVTLFRPYLWEAKNPLVLTAALQGASMLLLVIYLLLKVNPARIVMTILKDPLIQFCVLFAILFSIMVGIASFNFGALDRYRIPCIPFFLLAIFMILNRNNKLPLSKPHQH